MDKGVGISVRQFSQHLFTPRIVFTLLLWYFLTYTIYLQIWYYHIGLFEK